MKFCLTVKPKIALVLCATLFSLSESVKAQLVWTNRPISGLLLFEDAIFANNKFYLGSRVYTSGTGITGSSFSSVNGQTWQGAPASQWIEKAAFGNGLFAGTQSPLFFGAVSKIYTSSNRISWTAAFTFPETLQDYLITNLTFNGAGFAFFYSQSRFYKSDSLGKNWTSSNFTLPAPLDNLSTTDKPSLVFGAGLYVATVKSVDGKHWIISSTNGTTWTVRYTGTNGDISPSRVKFANGLFVAVCGAGRIITSPNGITWTLRSVGGFTTFTDAAFGNNTWVLVGTCGAIWTSIDNGLNWTQNVSGTFGTFLTVTFGKNTFLAAGDAMIYQSN